MTHLVNLPTKKALREAIAAGRNVRISDPNSHYYTLRDIHDRVGHSVTVSDWKRRWYATITVKADRKLVVR